METKKILGLGQGRPGLLGWALPAFAVIGFLVAVTLDRLQGVGFLAIVVIAIGFTIACSLGSLLIRAFVTRR